MPVSKTEGDTVIGGTINQSGCIHVRALRVGSSTGLKTEEKEKKNKSKKEKKRKRREREKRKRREREKKKEDHSVKSLKSKKPTIFP